MILKREGPALPAGAPQTHGAQSGPNKSPRRRPPRQGHSRGHGPTCGSRAPPRAPRCGPAPRDFPAPCSPLPLPDPGLPLAAGTAPARQGPAEGSRRLRRAPPSSPPGRRASRETSGRGVRAVGLSPAPSDCRGPGQIPWAPGLADPTPAVGIIALTPRPRRGVSPGDGAELSPDPRRRRCWGRVAAPAPRAFSRLLPRVPSLGRSEVAVKQFWPLQRSS